MQYVIRTIPQMRGPHVLGIGNTEEEAWLNAMGPKPWHPIVEESSKKCWCEKIEPEAKVSYYTW